MQQSGCKVDVIGYSSMIHVAAKVGDADKAEEWMLEMISVGLVPNTICYNTLFHACALTGHHEKAATWMSKMHMTGAAKPNVITYNCLIDACVNAGNKTAASTWLQEMIEQGLDPDDTTLLKLSGGGSKCKSRTPQVPAWACYAILAGYTRRGDARGVQHWTKVANDLGCAIPGSHAPGPLALQDTMGNLKGRRTQKAPRQPQDLQRSLRDSLQHVLPEHTSMVPIRPRRQFTPSSLDHQADGMPNSSFPEHVLSERGHGPLYTIQAGSASLECAQRAALLNPSWGLTTTDSATPYSYEPKARGLLGDVVDAFTKPSAAAVTFPEDTCSTRSSTQGTHTTPSPSTSAWPGLIGGAGLLDGNQQHLMQQDVEGLRRLTYQPPPGLEVCTVQKPLSPAEMQAISL